MRKLQYALAFCALLIGCGWWGQVARDTLEYVLCEKVAEKYPERLGGLTPSQWCEVYDNVKPFIPMARQMERQGAVKAGFSRGDSK